METLKFKAKDQNQKDFAKELNKRVRQQIKENNISTFGDYRMVIKAIIVIGLYAGTFAVLLTVNMNPWLALLLMIIMGIGEAGIGMGVMHDAVHGTFSKKKWLNKIMANSIYLLGSTVINWKVQHNLFHHTYPNVYDWDEDRESKPVIRLSEHAPMKKIYKYQHIFGLSLYGLMTLIRLFGDFGQLKNYNKVGALKFYKVTYAKAVTEAIITKSIYLAIFFGLPLWLTDFTWWQVLIGFVVMHGTASMIMGTVFQLAHVVENVEEPLPDENGVIHNHQMVHQLQTTSNFGRRNGLMSWYVGGLDFQVEHHLYPGICHIHYPKLAKIVEATAKEFNQPYHVQETALDALGSHLRTLKRLGRPALAKA